MQVLLSLVECFKFFSYITCSVQQIAGLGGTLGPKITVWSTCVSRAYLRVFVIPCVIHSLKPPLWNAKFGMDSEARGVAMRSMSVILMLAVLWHCNFRACDREKCLNVLNDNPNGTDAQDPFFSRALSSHGCTFPKVLCSLGPLF